MSWRHSFNTDCCEIRNTLHRLSVKYHCSRTEHIQQLNKNACEVDLNIGPYIPSCWEMFLPFWSHHSVLALLNFMTWEKTAVFYISFVLLDGQHASCFRLLSFHKNLRKCRSKPSANTAPTKYNQLLSFSELNESSLLLFFLIWVALSFFCLCSDRN